MKKTMQSLLRGLALLCLLQTAAPLHAQVCPAYPRNLNEVYACVSHEKMQLGQRASLHNPAIPANGHQYFAMPCG